MLIKKNQNMFRFIFQIATAFFLAVIGIPSVVAAVKGESQADKAVSISAGDVSNDRFVEIKTVGANLWHLLTRSRLVHITLVDRADGIYVELLPFNYQGISSPFSDDNNLSLEIDPGTPQARVIPLAKDGSGGRLISTKPLSATSAFDASLYMDEGTHYHRLRFRFPGRP